MTFKEALQAARTVASYDEADKLLKSIELDFATISDDQYYRVKRAAIDAAFNYIINH